MPDADRIDLQVGLDALLAFLRVKGGQGPNELELRLSPGMDLTEFYGAQSIVNDLTNGAASAANITLSSPLSTSPRRYLGASAQMFVGAAGGTWMSLGIGFSINTGTGVNLTLFGDTLIEAPKAGAAYQVSMQLPAPLIMPPQVQVTAIARGDAGGADHSLQLRYMYQRLDGLP